VIGWYSTGPKLRSVDISIHELFRSYTPHPILVIIDVNPLHDPLEIPTLAYVSVESSPDQQRASRRQFAHLPSEIGAYEAEEVGVEHLLRNLRDSTESSLGEQVNAKLVSLKGLSNRLGEVHDYLTRVERGELPVSQPIVSNVQDMMNLLPNVQAARLQSAISELSNDNAMALYVSSLVRSILALHDLIVNKHNNQRLEKAEREREKDDGSKEQKPKEQTNATTADSKTAGEKDEQKKKEDEDDKKK
jgi:26S proteasome regulatory subunit N8